MRNIWPANICLLGIFVCIPREPATAAPPIQPIAAQAGSAASIPLPQDDDWSWPEVVGGGALTAAFLVAFLYFVSTGKPLTTYVLQHDWRLGRNRRRPRRRRAATGADSRDRDRHP